MGSTTDEGDVADALAQQLARAGELVDVGAFTLDPDKARAKLREHQLEDPSAFVLLLVEAAWIAGDEGTRAGIRFQIGATTSAEFHGMEFAAHELANVLGAVFGRERGLTGEARARARVLRLLGLATNAALALEPEAVIIEHVDGQGQRLRLEFGPEGPPRIERGQAQTRLRTRFELRGSGFDLRRPERELLLERCRYASFPIEVDGSAINSGFHSLLGRSGGQAPTVAITLGEPPRGVGAAAMLDQAAPARLLLLTRGVLSETLTSNEWQQGFVAIADVDLDKDLSQRRIVRGPAFDQVMLAVNAAHARLPKPRLKPTSTVDGERSRVRLVVAALGFAALAISGLVYSMLALSLHSETAPTPAPTIDLSQYERLAKECDADNLAPCTKLYEMMLDDPEHRAQALDALESLCSAGEPSACEAFAKHAPAAASSR